MFDENYTPTTPEEIKDFQHAQEFAFSVFTAHLLDPKSAVIVRKYSDKTTPAGTLLYGDSQKLYKELVKAHEKGVTASLKAAAIEKSFHKDEKLKLTNSYNKSLTTWFSNFETQILTLDLTAETPKDDAWKLNTLTQAVIEHEAMCNHIEYMKTSALAAAISNGTDVKPFDYNTTLHLCKAHAETLDQQAKDIRHQQRNVNNLNRNTDNPSRGQGRGRNTSSSGRGQGRDGRGRATQGGRSSNNANSLRVPKDVWNSLPSAVQEVLKAAKKDQQTQPSTETSTVPTQVQVNSASSVVSEPVTVGTTRPANTAPGSVLRGMLSANHAQRGTSDTADTITVNGETYTRSSNVHKVSYRVHNYDRDDKPLASLVDGGCNGGMAGEDMRVLSIGTGIADITGIADHQVTDLKIGQVAGITKSTDGPIIVIGFQYALFGKGKTVHSKGQMEHFGMLIDDKSRKCGGKQCLFTPDGYTIPLHIRDGLCYMDMRPPTDEELNKYPHVFLTEDMPWDPRILDNEFTEDEFHDCLMPEDFGFVDPRVNNYGELNLDHAQFVNNCLLQVQTNKQLTNNYEIYSTQQYAAFPVACKMKKKEIDLQPLRPNFGWAPTTRIGKTLENTTQFFHAVIHYPFKKHYKSRNPGANVNRLPEWFATDTIICDTPAADDGIGGHGGSTMFQLYAGMKSFYLAGSPMKKKSQFLPKIVFFCP